MHTWMRRYAETDRIRTLLTLHSFLCKFTECRKNETSKNAIVLISDTNQDADMGNGENDTQDPKVLNTDESELEMHYLGLSTMADVI